MNLQDSFKQALAIAGGKPLLEAADAIWQSIKCPSLEALVAETKIEKKGELYYLIHRGLSAVKPFDAPPTPSQISICHLEAIHAWQSKKDALVEVLMESLFDTICQAYPSTTTGDLSPALLARLEQTLSDTVNDWAEANASPSDIALPSFPDRVAWEFDHPEAKGKVTARRGAYGVELRIEGVESSVYADLFPAVNGEEPRFLYHRDDDAEPVRL